MSAAGVISSRRSPDEQRRVSSHRDLTRVCHNEPRPSEEPARAQPPVEPRENFQGF